VKTSTPKEKTKDGVKQIKHNVKLVMDMTFVKVVDIADFGCKSRFCFECYYFNNVENSCEICVSIGACKEKSAIGGEKHRAEADVAQSGENGGATTGNARKTAR
jgi:hypothetical protein